MRWPVALVAILLAICALLVGGVLLLRQLTSPPITATPVPVTAVALVPTAPATSTVSARTAVAPTIAPTVASAPTAVPTPAPAAAPLAQPTDAGQVPAGVSQTPDASPLPTVPPELRREVEAAYNAYWDARAQAVWTLDPAPLDDVATGDELDALRRDVEQLRSDGRAIKAELQHQYTVINVDGDQARVLDRVRDFSIYVDATSKQPLPGQVRPDDASAPLTTSLFYLRNTDGNWKVDRVEAYANN